MENVVDMMESNDKFLLEKMKVVDARTLYVTVGEYQPFFLHENTLLHRDEG